MLTRVFKKTFVEGWSLKEDSKFKFNYTMPPKFADDAKISEWAKPSVYFMVSHGIIKGIDSKNFAPKATTSAEQAANYASATREQSIIIAVRMAENLDKDDAKEIIPPSQSSETTNTSSVVGSWLYTAVNGNVGFSIFYEFKNDGTFSKVLGTIVNGLYSTTLFEGKYKISENKIALYEQKKSEANALYWEELWKVSYPIIVNIPVEDEEFIFEITNDGKLKTTKNLTDVTEFSPF